MKVMTLLIGMLCMGSMLWALTGCQTNTPGETNTLGSVSQNFDGTPDKVCNAAFKAANDLHLQNVQQNHTDVDGHVTATTASGTDVKIDVSQNGEKISKVTIRVGATGDPAVSQQLMDGIKKHLSWF